MPSTATTVERGGGDERSAPGGEEAVRETEEEGVSLRRGQWFVCWGNWESERSLSPAIGRIVSVSPWRLEDRWIYPRAEFVADVKTGKVVLLQRPCVRKP